MADPLEQFLLMPAQSVAENCPVRLTLAKLDGKWRLLIISYLMGGDLRYGELKRRLPDISEKMLITELKRLQADGIVGKVSYHEIPPRVHYFLTERGKALRPVIEAMLNWGLVEMQSNKIA